MKLCLINHDYKYELEKLIRLFLPFEKIEFLNYEMSVNNCAVSILQEQKSETNAVAFLYLNDKCYKSSLEINKSENNNELILATALYNCFKEASGYKPPWGLLTGVRPAKLFSQLSKSSDQTKAYKWFKEKLFVDDNKIQLCKDTFKKECNITESSSPNSFSLYISIPFCPTRCSYCSFVSHSIEHAKNLIPDYLKLLLDEIIETSIIAEKINLKLETVYIGGGTPTTLTNEQLSLLLNTINEHFDISKIKEFTVEAGRPDTITESKLITIKESNVTRISINPQTMNDDVLKYIKRNHTSNDTIKAFSLARDIGFNNINMDLIAGLPSDFPESFKNTISKVVDLNPESVTVHALSMKRASNMTKDSILPDNDTGNQAAFMVDYARKTLTDHGILPYYMYRQSKTVGNLENVGYSKEGCECLYNVFIMDETHTILACGASAVTKLREPYGKYIDRIFNYKYPYEYINRFGDLLKRKEGIYKFYEKYPAIYK